MDTSSIDTSGLRGTFTLGALAQTRAQAAAEAQAAAAETSEETVAAQTAAAETDAAQASLARDGSVSMVANLFFDADGGQSEYIEAGLKGARAARNLDNTMAAQLTKMAGELPTYLGGKGSPLTEEQIRQRVLGFGRQAVVESHEDVLEQARQDMEDRADAANAPTDENGDPLPATDGTETAPAPDAAVDTTPDAATATDATGAATSDADAAAAAALAAGVAPIPATTVAVVGTTLDLVV